MNLFDGCKDQSLANDLAWLREPPEWRFSNEELTIVPEPISDFFRPYKREPHDNAALLYKHVSGDFTVVSKVRADLVAFGDAPAITVRASETKWAKLCLERSPIGDISLVAVVTDPWSDDCNSELVDRAECYLRLTRKGDVFGMHYSLTGTRWRFVRTFALEMPPTVMVGVHAQAPFQGGCRATFSFLNLRPEPVKDFRSGE